MEKVVTWIGLYYAICHANVNESHPLHIYNRIFAPVSVFIYAVRY